MSESATIESAEDWESSLAEEEDLSDLEAEATDEEPTDSSEPEPDDELDAEPEEAEAEDDAEIAVEADPEPAEGDEPAEPEAPEVAEPEAAAPEIEPPLADDQPAPEQVPWSAKADGVEITLNGATITPDGMISIPKETWTRDLQPYLADRSSLRSQMDRKIAETERRYSELEASKSEAEVRAQAVTDHFANLLDKGQDAVWEWLQDFSANRGKLEAELAAAQANHQVSQLEGKVSSYEAEHQERATRQSVEAFQKWAPGAISDAVDSLLNTPELSDAGLDKSKVVEQLGMFGNDLLFFTAGDDIPEWGVSKGDIVPNWDFLARQLSIQADLSRSLRSQANEVAQAQQANSKALRDKRKAPPSVPAGGTPAPGGKTPKLETRADWEAFMAEDEPLDY